MKFSHLVEINDPLNPLIERLTRAQLWRGLVLRAEQPKAFVSYLDNCRITETSSDSLSRELQYGELTVRDEVTLVAQQRVIYRVPAQKDIAASSLTVTIEEPEPEVLFVRFEYDNGASEEDDATTAFYDDFRRSAYVESDVETIRTIRQMAEDGRLTE